MSDVRCHNGDHIGPSQKCMYIAVSRIINTLTLKAKKKKSFVSKFVDSASLEWAIITEKGELTAYGWGRGGAARGELALQPLRKQRQFPPKSTSWPPLLSATETEPTVALIPKAQSRPASIKREAEHATADTC